MEFGSNNQQPLLSIAIPTWNRAEQLQVALRRLLPSISKFGRSIELIISDNGSEDNTQEIIAETLLSYDEINLNSFKHEVNTGFFGNFKKCISLGTGKYFWLLSDDDFLFEGVIETIMEILSSKADDVGAIFLDDWTNDESDVEKHSYNIVNKEDFFKIGGYRHTLISSVIYAHNVQGNDDIFDALQSNSLIGYPIFLKSVANYDSFGIIKGNALLKTNDEEVRFDALGIFTVELAECLKIGYEVLPTKIMDFIANQFLATLIFTHYKDFKYKGRYNNERNQSYGIFKYYLKYKNFWKYIFPVILLDNHAYDNFNKFVRKNITKSF